MATCPSVNSLSEPLEWGFASSLGFCVYNANDKASFIFGWISVFVWTFALTPQIVTNFMQGSAKSQSIMFWGLWLVGDAFNVSGCIMSGTLPTNTALASVYFAATIVAFGQMVYYGYYTKSSDEIMLSPKRMSVSPQKETTALMQRLAAIKSRGSKRAVDKSIGSMMRPISMTPNLFNAIRIASASPRVFGYAYSLDRASLREFETLKDRHLLPSSLQLSARPHHKRFSMMSPVAAFKLDNASNVGRAITDPLGGHRSPKPFVMEQLDESETPPMLGSATALVHSTTDPKNYGSLTGYKMTGVGSALSMIGALFYVLMPPNSVQMSADIGDGGMRHLLKQSVETTNDSQRSASVVMAGVICGFIAAAIYVISRIPQLHLMISKKEVSGINPLLFAMSFLGNLTQGLAMMVQSDMYHRKALLVSFAPWLLGASLCMFQDLLIIFLIAKYKKQAQNLKNLSDIEIASEPLNATRVDATGTTQLVSAI